MFRQMFDYICWPVLNKKQEEEDDDEFDDQLQTMYTAIDPQFSLSVNLFAMELYQAS